MPFLVAALLSTTQLQHGINQANTGHYRDAVSELREFIARYPSHIYADYAHYWLAYAHFRNHEYALAEVTTDFLLFRHPTSFRLPEARALNALSRWQRGEHEKSGEELKHWLVENPGSDLAPLVEQTWFASKK